MEKIVFDLVKGKVAFSLFLAMAKIKEDNPPCAGLKTFFKNE